MSSASRSSVAVSVSARQLIKHMKFVSSLIYDKRRLKTHLVQHNKSKNEKLRKKTECQKPEQVLYVRKIFDFFSKKAKLKRSFDKNKLEKSRVVPKNAYLKNRPLRGSVLFLL